MDTADLRAIINKIADKSKDESRVDTGFLKRSIYGIINERGVPEFGEMFYGQFGENSRLAENIKSMFPKDLPYKLVYYDFDGGEYVAQEKKASGRLIQRETIPNKIKDTAPPTTSKNIRNFTNYITAVASVRDSESSKKVKTNAEKSIQKYLNSLKDGTETDTRPKE